MDDLISKQEVLEDLSEPFVMSQCLTVEECETMNRARKLCLARVENIEPAQQWVPVTERLPEEERNIYWVYTDFGSMHECRWTNNRFGLGESDTWGWSIFDVPQHSKVTHWRELPEPPKEEP